MVTFVNPKISKLKKKLNKKNKKIVGWDKFRVFMVTLNRPLGPMSMNVYLPPLGVSFIGDF